MLLLILACTQPVPEDSGSTAPDTADTTADSGDTDTSVAAVSGVEARIDSEFGTLVYVSWQQGAAAEAWVEYSFEEGSWQSSPPVSVATGEQEALLLGIPYDAEVSLRVVNDFGGGALASEAITTTTDPLPSGLPTAEVLIDDPTRQDPEAAWIFMSITEAGGGIAALYSDWWVFIMDRQGRIVWARETPSDSASLHPRIAHDGTALLIEEGTFWGGGFDFGTNSIVQRMTLDGVVSQVWATPGLHHPFTDTADGSLVWAANAGTNETLQMITPDGEQVEIWDCKAHLHSVGLTGDCGSNSIYWHEPTDTFLYSFYSLFTMFEITPDGEVTRTFGPLETGWDFAPAESAFWWQHGGYYTPEGTLLVSTYVEEEGTETIVREFALDDDTQTLTEIWNFGIGDGIWGEYMGEPHRLDNGNILHNTGSAARLREATADGEVVWDISWGDASTSHWIGRSTPVSDLYDLVE
ncbi:MAG: hypothetical protein ACI8RZ_003292 [Myxococcota bacterium]|jgi:hypothetical protein